MSVVLVTGGSGTLGTHLVAALRERVMTCACCRDAPAPGARVRARDRGELRSAQWPFRSVAAADHLDGRQTWAEFVRALP